MTLDFSELVTSLTNKFAKKSHTQDYSTITVSNSVTTSMVLTENHSEGNVELSCDIHILENVMMYKLPIKNASVKFYGNNVLLGTVVASDSGTAQFSTSIEETTVFKCVFDATGDYPSGESNTVSVEMGIDHIELTFTGTSFSSYNTTPFTYTGDVTYTVDDGAEQTYTGGKLSVSGLSSGTHTLKIYGNVTSLISGCFGMCSSLTSITIPDSVTSLGDACFYDCSSLTSITIPDSVTSLGDACFYDCSSLTSITISSSVTSLGNDCFYNCTGLTSINIPDSVTSLGNSCFYNCTGLTSINIPDSVTSLGNDCFYSCTGLTSITISSSVTSLGNYCFCVCSSLTSITIPDSVTSLGIGCFGICSSLTSITIPSSVTIIGQLDEESYSDGYCFYECSNLKTIHFKSTTPPSFPHEYGEPSFEYIASDPIAYVPIGTTEAYTTALDSSITGATFTIIEEV